MRGRATVGPSAGSDLSARRILPIGGAVAIGLALIFGLFYFHERSVVSDKKSELATAQARLVAQSARAEPIKEAQAASAGAPRDRAVGHRDPCPLGRCARRPRPRPPDRRQSDRAYGQYSRPRPAATVPPRRLPRHGHDFTATGEQPRMTGSRSFSTGSRLLPWLSDVALTVDGAQRQLRVNSRSPARTSEEAAHDRPDEWPRCSAARRRRVDPGLPARLVRARLASDLEGVEAQHSDRRDERAAASCDQPARRADRPSESRFASGVEDSCAGRPEGVRRFSVSSRRPHRRPESSSTRSLRSRSCPRRRRSAADHDDRQRAATSRCSASCESSDRARGSSATRSTRRVGSTPSTASSSAARRLHSAGSGGSTPDRVQAALALNAFVYAPPRGRRRLPRRRRLTDTQAPRLTTALMSSVSASSKKRAAPRTPQRWRRSSAVRR